MTQQYEIFYVAVQDNKFDLLLVFMQNGPENIPIPDTSGASNTQVVEAFSPQPESPMSMGSVAYGLAADSGSGLNRQAAMIVTTDYVHVRKRLEEKEQRLEEVLPKLAVMETENKALRKQRKSVHL
jgi:hypothetical protein